MKRTIFSYIIQYATLACIFLIAFIFERELGLFSLTLWLLSYLAYRRTSPAFLLFLALVFDLFFFNLLGSTLIFLSVELLLFEYLGKKKIAKKIQWLCTFLFIGLYASLLRHSLSAPIGFFVSSFLFFIPFVYRIRIRDLLFHTYA